MPEEVASYIEKKYLELKEKAKTYRELEKLICRASREEGYRNHNWGSFFHVQVNGNAAHGMG